MSPPGLFVAGGLVTLIVILALVLLVYAAVLDGQYSAAKQREREQEAHAEAESEPAVLA